MNEMSSKNAGGDTGPGGRGRSVVVAVAGADMDSLEAAALDRAREFFGPEAQLEVVASYQAGCDATAPPERRFSAGINVRLIES